MPPSCTSKCRCGPVDMPEEPTSTMCRPAVTVSPTVTWMPSSHVWTYAVATVAPSRRCSMTTCPPPWVGVLRAGECAGGGGGDRGAIGGGEIAAGVQRLFPGDRMRARPERRRGRPRALRQREHDPRRLCCHGHRAPARTLARVGGEGVEDVLGDGSIVVIAVRERRDLHRLDRLAFAHLFPAGNVEQPRSEEHTSELQSRFEL